MDPKERPTLLRKVRRLMKLECWSNMVLVPGGGFAEIEEGAGHGGPGGESDGIEIGRRFGEADIDQGFG